MTIHFVGDASSASVNAAAHELEASFSPLQGDMVIIAGVSWTGNHVSFWNI